MASTAQPFGIDFGGTGIKGAPVDLERGEFAAERVRVRTPEESTPQNVAEIFVELLAQFPDCTGAVGVTVALGYYFIALAVSVLAVLVLAALRAFTESKGPDAAVDKGGTEAGKQS
jgi:polyphosphate glucokinase